MRCLLVTSALLLVASGCHKGSGTKRLKIAAAADLGKAFTELGEEFHKQTGIEVELTFGSSGLLARQLEQGADFGLFAAANEAFVDDVVRAGVCDAASAQLYRRGKIVAWVPEGTVAPKTIAELADPRFAKIAIANPDHAPYGLAAKQALVKAGLWDQLQPRLVLGENVQATMTFASSGNTDIAIIALSLAGVASGGTFLTIDESLYTPLNQKLVACGSGDQLAQGKQFAQFVNSATGREVLTRYGFTPPTK